MSFVKDGRSLEISNHSRIYFCLFVRAKRGVSLKVYLKSKKGGLFMAKLYLFLCKIGVRIAENVLETALKRGAILSSGTIMHYAFKYKVTTPG